ncbi:L,D-transpeptidase [Paenibacillus sp. GCM10027626]|uniref:L,D-transpeptidase n=1 Tax=Paenibacillus sp. GCM10027626 TaxID=3273411 RepID=UPI00363F4A77
MGEQSEHMGYLKQYVQQHPDNQMAWYLLGKEYVAEGKEAKANYCFLQAGNIYEAYERKRHPLAKEPQLMIESWNRKRRTRSIMRRAALLAILLLAMLLTSPLRLEDETNREKPAITEAEVQLPSEAAYSKMVFTTVDMLNPLSASMALMLDNKGGQRPDNGLVVALENKQQWRRWTGNTRLLLSLQKEGGAAYNMKMLDASSCECQPADAAEAYKAWESWREVQEERWTLASGIYHYHELFERWPSSLDDLIRPYPNNVIAGESPSMRSLFPDMLAALKLEQSGGKGTGDGKKKELRAGALNGRAVHLPVAPLSIIVDTDSHTLSVVTGDVIVRSYPIGLGGERTPGGSFYISEKVKNPNGRDDGEFGSRGMTLSGTRYAIHGTNEPDSIGKDESLGCIRMAKEDVEELYDLVPLGTKVTIKSGVLPEMPGKRSGKRFRLQPLQDETNPAVIYRWLF